jgi:hypothetical protein
MWFNKLVYQFLITKKYTLVLTASWGKHRLLIYLIAWGRKYGPERLKQSAKSSMRLLRIKRSLILSSPEFISTSAENFMENIIATELR